MELATSISEEDLEDGIKVIIEAPHHSHIINIVNDNGVITISTKNDSKYKDNLKVYRT